MPCSDDRPREKDCCEGCDRNCGACCPVVNAFDLLQIIKIIHIFNLEHVIRNFHIFLEYFFPFLWNRFENSDVNSIEFAANSACNFMTGLLSENVKLLVICFCFVLFCLFFFFPSKLEVTEYRIDVK